MSVEKSRNSYSFTDRKGEVDSGADPCAKDGRTLRGVDILGADRAAEIIVPLYDRSGPFVPAPLRSFAPPAPRVRRRQRVLRYRFDDAAAIRLARMHKALQIACRVSVLQAMPGPSERQTSEWEMMRSSPEDWGDVEIVTGPDGVGLKHKAPRCTPSRPSAPEVDLATKVFELVFALKMQDEFAAYLAISRAMPKAIAWKDICKKDPKRRVRAQLVVQRNNALARLAELADQRGVKLDIFELDTLDKKRA